MKLQNISKKGAATTERYLRSLKDKELIEYKGSHKTGGYYKKIT